MQHILHEHILRLEDRIQALSDQLTDPERDRLSDELRVAELALAYYRKAFELEQQIGAGGTSLTFSLFRWGRRSSSRPA
jgi:hypothetical protein